MKTLIMALFCTVFTAGTVMAQSSVTQETPVTTNDASAKFVNDLKTKVMLTDAETAEYMELRQKYDQEKNRIATDNTLSKKEKNALLSELNESYKTEVINRTSEDKYKKIEGLKPF